MRRAFDEIIAAAKRYAPHARVNGVLVQPMVPADSRSWLALRPIRLRHDRGRVGRIHVKSCGTVLQGCARGRADAERCG